MVQSGNPQRDSVTIGGASFRDKLAAMALDLPDFRDELERGAKEIREIATPTATEATVEGHFESVLYATLREIGVRFIPEKEVHVGYRRHVGKGRMDSRIGAVVIEYKRPRRLRTDKQRKEAFQQLEDYVVSIGEGDDAEIRGFVTDGRNIAELRSHDGHVTRSPFTKLDGASLMRLTKTIVSLRLQRFGQRT